jgi:hypothetical protein
MAKTNRPAEKPEPTTDGTKPGAADAEPVKLIPGTPYPDLRVANPKPGPNWAPPPARDRPDGQSPHVKHLSDDQVGLPRAAIRGVTKPAPKG